MPAIPVIPFQGQEFEDQMESQKGKIGLKDMLNSKDKSGNTLFQNLLHTAGDMSGKGKNFLNNTVVPALGDLIWGETPDIPSDMQGTEMVEDPQNPGKFIHPGALQMQQRDADSQFNRPMF